MRFISIAVLALALFAGDVAFAAPAISFQMDQSPVTGNNVITNAAATNTAYWGTLKGSGALPTPVGGATANTGNAWQFNRGYYLALGPNAVTKSLGDITNTPGLSVAFWVEYQNQTSDQWARLCGLGGSGECFDFSIQNAGAGVGLGLILFTAGYQDANNSRWISVQPGKTVFDGKWHQVVATVDFRKTNNNVVVYLDGIAARKATSSPLVGSFTNSGSLNIGARGNGSPWGGAIDQFMVFTNALQPAEVAQLYSGGIISNYAPVVMIRPMSATLEWTNGTASLSLPLTAAITDDGLPNPPGHVTNVWTETSGPATVTFNNPTASTMTATFTKLGAYVLRCTAGDGLLSDYDEVNVLVASNSPPQIWTASATPATLLNTNGGAVSLSAYATDDGLPNPPGTVTGLWSQVSGPGTVTFIGATNLNATAIFPANAGAYILHFQAGDGQKTSVTNLVVNVVTNLPPTVNLSVDAPTIVWPGASTNTTLRAVIADDGRPNPPGTVTNLWTQLSGPSATLAAPDAANCDVTFSGIGQYIFQCVASDGAASATNTTWVNVWSPSRPLVLAGSSRSVWLPNAMLTLSGSYTNTSGGVALGWSLAQGPGNVTFGSPDSLTTTATFTNAGTYVVDLGVTNGTFINHNSLVVQVYAATNNFNYSAAQLGNFTNDLGIAHDFSGLDWNALKPPPPPYVHPRLLFNAEDVPDLRARLTSATLVGPVLMNTIRTTLANNLTGPAATAQFRQAYDDLSVGITSSFDALPNSDYLVGALSYECFRCLIDNDAAGGAKAGAALATIANEAYAKMAALHSSDWRDVNSLLIHYQFMAYAYDFDYNFMTPDEQAAVRRALALATSNQWSIGMEALPAMTANCSNWINNNALYLLLNALAIEGETGYDTNCLPRLEACYDRFFSIGCFADGALFEGMGKGSIYGETMIALGKRGDWIGATDAVRNHIRQFYLQSLETTGFGFTWDELIGSSFGSSKYADIPALKWLYPNDPIIDFMQRNDYGQANYLSSGRITSVNLGFVYDVTETLVRAILAQDFNTDLNFPQALASQVATNALLTCLFNERGLLITRSDWTTNALRLYFQPRCEPGGHSEPDRNAFDLSALGRIWVPELNGWASPPDMSAISSVPRIDGTGPSIVSAAVVAFSDTPNFTCAAGDAHDSYSYIYTTTTISKPNVTNGWPIGYTYNQKLFQTNALPWFNLPWGQLPNWYDSTATNPTVGSTARYWTNWGPVLKAFRTAGVVRGSTPYVLIVDDIRQDDSPRAYDWRMMLAQDLTNASFAVSGNDCVITPASGNGKLLVRVLASASPPNFVTTNIIAGQPMLDILETNVAPDFKIMLLPYTNAAPPATTTWSNQVLTVAMADGQTDRVDFNTNYADGRTRLAEYRVAGLGAVLPAPTNLLAAAGDAQAALTWSPVAGADSYNVRVSNDGGLTCTLLATNVPVASFNATGLSNGAGYAFVVSAVNTNGESENSAPATVIPQAVVSPPVMESITISNGNLVISGTNATGAGNYLVLTSTNLALPMSAWATNSVQTFGPGGVVQFSIPLTNGPQLYLRLRTE